MLEIIKRALVYVQEREMLVSEAAAMNRQLEQAHAAVHTAEAELTNAQAEFQQATQVCALACFLQEADVPLFWHN